MIADAGWPLQQAVYTFLAASSVADDVTGIFDHVPEGTGFPYLTIGEATSTDWSSKSFDGQEHSLTFHVWSRQSGRREAKELLAKIYQALHEQALAVTGHQLVSLRYEFSQTFKDPDGVTHHGVIRFRARTIPF